MINSLSANSQSASLAAFQLYCVTVFAIIVLMFYLENKYDDDEPRLSVSILDISHGLPTFNDSSFIDNIQQ